jgi:hypothetical protein
MADMYWQIDVNPITHRELSINVGGKVAPIMATVPRILSHLKKHVPSDRMISGYFFSDNVELSEETNENLRQKVRTAIRSYNHWNGI